MKRDCSEKKRAARKQESRAVAVEPAPSIQFPRTDAIPGSDARGAEEVLLALAMAVEQRDNVTAGHCERLALTSLALGMAMSLDEASLQTLYRGGFLHDIGKVGIPDSILLKPAKLNAEEWVIMQEHPYRGAQICGHLQSLAPVLPLVRHHHERWDGTGYPDRLRGNQIPLLARVLQIADIYDALTNSRCYKPAYTPKEAIRIIEEETARGWRDPEIVANFLRIHSEVVGPLVDCSRKADGNLAALNRALINVDPIMKPIASFFNARSFHYLSGPAA
jgi:HD-GYP domain-containing protein (c-di-GMP phosphodiesterase class II)